jgi:hypothetical protein
VLEVVRPGHDAAVPAGTEIDAGIRAATLTDRVPTGAVVAGRTAAWVHAGPAAAAGDRLDLTYRSGGHRPAVWGAGLVWQAPLLREDTVQVGGVRVTTPARTATDVALHVEPTEAVRAIVVLVGACGVDPEHVRRQLERRVRAVGRPRARAVLRAVDAALP